MLHDKYDYMNVFDPIGNNIIFSRVGHYSNIFLFK